MNTLQHCTRGSCAAAALIFLGASCLVTSRADNPRTQLKPIEVEAIPVALYEGKPYKTQVGELEYLAGFELLSGASGFGGLSGLALSPDGRFLYAVSDRGTYLTAHLSHDADGRLETVDSWHTTPILNDRGQVVRGREGDAEAIVIDAGDMRLISFEGRHRIRSYSSNGDTGMETGKVVPTPPELADAPTNGGLESLTLLPDGTLMALTEYYENPDGSVKGWLISNGRAVPIAYGTHDGFSPSDIAGLPDGDVLVLERKFSITNMAVRIRKVRLADIRSGRTLSGRQIAEIRHPLVVDNFEGLAVRRGPGGTTLVYLLSDDNFMPFQRTLLLQFRLAAEAGAAVAAREQEEAEGEHANDD